MSKEINLNEAWNAIIDNCKKYVDSCDECQFDKVCGGIPLNSVRIEDV